MLTRDELERYDRQLKIDGFGVGRQEKLKQAKVFIAGAGGLGSPVSIYLAAAGIGTMRLAEHDKVEMNNLNRQILFSDEDIGKSKAALAAEKLHKLNPEIKVEATGETITEANVFQLVDGFDLIVDALDNLPTRYVLNKAALKRNIPLFHGTVHAFQGRATTIIPGQTACLKCLYHGINVPREKCWVVGVTPGIIACIQATEVIKYITGIGELLTNRLLIFDGLNMEFSELPIKKDPSCECSGHVPTEV